MNIYISQMQDSHLSFTSIHAHYTKQHTHILCENVCLSTLKHWFQLIICDIATSCKGYQIHISFIYL